MAIVLIYLFSYFPKKTKKIVVKYHVTTCDWHSDVVLLPVRFWCNYSDSLLDQLDFACACCKRLFAKMDWSQLLCVGLGHLFCIIGCSHCRQIESSKFENYLLFDLIWFWFFDYFDFCFFFSLILFLFYFILFWYLILFKLI